MMKRTALTQAEVRALFSYNKRTGLFRWRTQYHASKIGAVAGSFSGRYVRIKFGGKSYPAHCLAWLYVTGKWPEPEIDHRDTDKHNNRWKNLREATRSQNCYNARPMQAKKYSPLKGVTWAKGRQKWMANIRDGRRYSTFIGYFDSAEEAHAAYARRAKELRGEFARAA